MLNPLITESDVKEYLGIPDFRHASKEVLVKFVSAIPYINKDVAIKIIEQYPAFSTCAKAFLQNYSAMVDKMLDDNGKSVEASMNGYQTALDAISEFAKLECTTAEDRRFFAEQMVSIADKMAVIDAANKSYHEDLARYTIGIIGLCLFIGCAMLGVNIKGVSIPRI